MVRDGSRREEEAKKVEEERRKREDPVEIEKAIKKAITPGKTIETEEVRKIIREAPTEQAKKVVEQEIERATVSKARATLEAKKKGDDKVRAQTLLNKHIKDLERGKFMTIEDRNFFAAYPELYPQAENIYNLGQKGGINNPVYAEANQTMNKAFETRAGDKNYFPNIPDLANLKVNDTVFGAEP